MQSIFGCQGCMPREHSKRQETCFTHDCSQAIEDVRSASLGLTVRVRRCHNALPIKACLIRWLMAGRRKALVRRLDRRKTTAWQVWFGQWNCAPIWPLSGQLSTRLRYVINSGNGIGKTHGFNEQRWSGGINYLGTRFGNWGRAEWPSAGRFTSVSFSILYWHMPRYPFTVSAFM